MIPVLVEGARLPSASELPASLAGLVRRQALDLSPHRFNFDSATLLRDLAIILAEEQANERQTVKGYRLALAAEDDGGDRQIGADAAGTLAADPQVAGVIGTLSSSVAQSVAPLLAKASIVQISPAATNDTLTRGAEPQASPERVWPTFFRISSRETLQGPFGADYAYLRAGWRTATVIHDNNSYGQDLAAGFARRFRSRGGKIEATLAVEERATDFRREADTVFARNPGGVYFGGYYPTAARLLTVLRARGYKGVVLGGDGLYAADFSKQAGGAGAGTLATASGEPADGLDTARTFQGTTGEHSFDRYGDTTRQAFTVYRSQGSRWLPIFSSQFEQ